MDRPQDPTSEVWPTPAAAPAPARKSRGRIERILVGAVVAFTGLVLLYGPGQAGMMIALAVVCTAGIGLIPIIFLSWVVGWIVFAVWDAISARRGVAPAT